MNSSPLISIIVITYNSAKFVTETLESVKKQTYRNIELIVSDDCSVDDTVKVCKNWLEQNGGAFTKTKLITTSENSGVTMNCNRGLNAAEGVWIKYLAGDDLLTKGCITRFIRVTKSKTDASFVFGSVVPFFEHMIFKPILAPKKFIEASADSQHVLLLTKGNCILGPASFISKSTLLAIGGFDSRIPMQEDYPLWIKATGQGHKLYFEDFNCAFYRIHDEGLTSSSYVCDSENTAFLSSKWRTDRLIRMPCLLKKKLYFHHWHVRLNIWRNSRKGAGLNRIYRYCSYLIDPVGVYIRISRKIHLRYEYRFNYIVDENLTK